MLCDRLRIIARDEPSVRVEHRLKGSFFLWAARHEDRRIRKSAESTRAHHSDEAPAIGVSERSSADDGVEARAGEARECRPRIGKYADSRLLKAGN